MIQKHGFLIGVLFLIVLLAVCSFVGPWLSIQNPPSPEPKRVRYYPYLAMDTESVSDEEAHQRAMEEAYEGHDHFDRWR